MTAPPACGSGRRPSTRWAGWVVTITLATVPMLVSLVVAGEELALGLELCGIASLALGGVVCVRGEILHPFVWWNLPFALYSISAPVLYLLGELERHDTFRLVLGLEFVALLVFSLVVGPLSPRSAGLDRAGREERLEQILGDLHIAHVRDSLGMSLSGGERRRVEIARALAADPRFVLLDEPFAGVDPISVIDIQKIVRELAGKGIGVLITDHNVRETLGVCSRSYIIGDGRVIATGSAEEILANAQVREVYLGQSFRL